MSELKHARDAAHAQEIVDAIFGEFVVILAKHPEVKHVFCAIGVTLDEGKQTATASVGSGDIAATIFNGIKVLAPQGEGEKVAP